MAMRMGIIPYIHQPNAEGRLSNSLMEEAAEDPIPPESSGTSNIQHPTPNIQ
jgi:hypothetical protein